MPVLLRPVLPAFLLLLALVIYFPGLDGPIFFDDLAALTDNTLVQIEGSSFDDWRTASLSSASGPLRRPIAMFTFAMNHVLSGEFTPFGLKLGNLLIHLLITVLFFFLCHKLVDELAPGCGPGTRRLVAITAAAIWLLHPLHVSTVLYAVQRMAQLSTLFVLAGLLMFAHYRSRWSREGAAPGEILAAALWVFLMTLLAVFSKENGVLLPWLVVVLEVTIFRGRWAGKDNRRLQVMGWCVLVLPLLAMSALLLFSPDSLIGGYRHRDFTLEERVLTQTRVLWRYLGWLVFPNITDMGFAHDDIPWSAGLLAPPTTLLAIVAWLVLLVVALRFRNRFPLLIGSVLFFLVAHSLESGFIPLEMVYEHRNYLPSALVCLALAWLLVIPASRSETVRVRYPVLGMLLLLSSLLFLRVQTWSDELLLARTNVENHPESSRSNYFYANAQLHRYRRSEELGLSEREAGESLLVARHFFERMHQTNPVDVSALVLLYYLDSQFFPDLRERVDWLAELERVLATRRLQSSDWNALDTLVDCLATGTCPAEESRVLRLLDALAGRYPRSRDIPRYRYTYLEARGYAPEDLMPILRDAQQRARGEVWLYLALISEQLKANDPPGIYATAGHWLRSDRNRYNLPQLKAMFESRPGVNAEVGSGGD